MLKDFLPSFLFLAILLFAPQLTWSQCPGCVVNVPIGLAEDTIYLGSVPDGESGKAYNNDISFRLPKTTTPVSATDPDVPPGLAIDEIVITSLSNLPPGLSWEANQSNYMPADESDGCIRICGTPLVAGMYTIEVKLAATIFVVTQEASFFIDMYIAPAVSTNDGFSMTNFEGCGEVEVEFVNNIPSNGDEGYSYEWDFGNGNTSIDENPANQVYNQAGTYYVNYTATVDTAGYFLTNVTVEESSCNDWPNQPPDLLINIYTINGQLVYQSPKQTNIWPPVSFSTNIRLDENTSYILEAIDEDGGINGADDQCVYHNFNILSNGTFIGPDWKISMEIFHPITVVNFTDTVTVFPVPDPPIVVTPTTVACPGENVVWASSITENIQWYRDGVPLDGETGQGLILDSSGVYQVAVTNDFGCSAFSDPVAFERLEAPQAPELSSDIGDEFCEGEEAILTSSYSTNNQWYLDGNEIPNATDATYAAGESGMYTVVFTNDQGCSATSPEYSIMVNPNPDEPAFENLNNVLTILPTVVFPDNYSLIWSYNGNILNGETSSSLCTNTPGTYATLLINEDTGCESFFSTEVNIDPNENCLVSSLEELSLSHFEAYPNPVEDVLQLKFQLAKAATLNLQLHDASGRQLHSWNLGKQNGLVQQTLDFSTYTAGFYFLQIRSEEGVYHYKIVKH